MRSARRRWTCCPAGSRSAWRSRALVGGPAIMLADEPTGALDPVTGKDIMELFASLNRNEGTTLIVITHDPEIASQCARRTRIGDGVLREEASAGA